MKLMADKDTVLVFCAHSDDQILGPGATLAKYAEEGKEVYTVIFSYGEVGGFWLKKEVAVETRVKEALAADKVIKGKGVAFLGLKEGHFLEEANAKKIYDRLKRLIQKHNPSLIFTHSDEDPLPDHRAVCKVVLDTVDRMSYAGSVYTFDVWNPVPLKKTDVPRIYVDIKKHFATKLRALKCFSSQWMSLISLTWSIYFRALKHGIRSGKWLAERFYKLR